MPLACGRGRRRMYEGHVRTRAKAKKTSAPLRNRGPIRSHDTCRELICTGMIISNCNYPNQLREEVRVLQPKQSVLAQRSGITFQREQRSKSRSQSDDCRTDVNVTEMDQRLSSASVCERTRATRRAAGFTRP